MLYDIQALMLNEVPPKHIIPASFLLKYMTDTDFEALKAYIRSYSQVYIETEGGDKNEV